MIRLLNLVKFLLSIHFLAILVFTFFRVILFYLQKDALIGLPNQMWLIFNAFFIGFRFDNVISSYFIVLPLLVFSLVAILNYHSKYLIHFFAFYLSFFYSLAFFISAGDIPYFIQFSKRINSSIFNWIDNIDFVFKMIIQEKSFLIFFLVFITIDFFFIRFILKQTKKYKHRNQVPVYNQFNFKTIFVKSITTLLLLLICFIGIRGRIEQKSPIKVGTAFFSNYNFPNQLALNPVFNFLRSCLDEFDPKNKYLNLMDNKLALHNVYQYFNLKKEEQAGKLIRHCEFDSISNNQNVVMVIMEGMSANLMNYFGNKNNLTPFLDSLVNQSYFFENFYSSGIHTMNGIYSSLISFPSLLNQHPLNIVDIPRYDGFASTLSKNGYSTIYFTTHDDQFDNVGGFLSVNGFNQIISQKNYPFSQVRSTLGVSDDFMFQYSMANLNEFKTPFFATYMTASNHGPYIIPTYFSPKHKEDKLGIVEYSDWALNRFFQEAKKQKWFNNTIFVFVADHGGLVLNNDYEMPLCYQHIPLIIYSSKFKNHKIESSMGGQIDIFPTIMGLLNKNYINTTLGVDLFKEKRPYIYFTADDKIACLDSSFYYIYTVDGKKEKLYDLKKNDRVNCLSSNLKVGAEMKKYSFSMLQTAQYLVINKNLKP